MKRILSLSPGMLLFALSFATAQPVMASGLSFDYTLGGHNSSIVDDLNNHRVWSEGVDMPTNSFLLDGTGYHFQPLDEIWYNTDEIRNASAALANASLGTMGVSAKVVDASGLRTAATDHAGAWVQMGGQFVIAGPAGTVDLKVRTTLDGLIAVALQPGIDSRSLITLEMGATSVDYTPGNYFQSATGWGISSRSIEETGLFLNNDQISDSGSYQFSNYEITLTLAAVKTNQVFNLDLYLNTELDGPPGGTVGDQVAFLNTYSMGFTNNNPEQWFELPAGYSITTAPVPETETWALLLAGLGLVGWAARRPDQVPHH